MKFRSILSVAVLFSELLAPQSNALAHTVAVPAPMQYYLADIEAPFAAVTTLIELRRICEKKFPGECRNLTTDRTASLKDEAELLGSISLFSVPRHRYRAEQFASPHEVAQALDTQKPALIAELKKFDLRFIGRFGATADVCPYSKKQGRYVAILSEIVLHQYWNMQDSELNAAIAEIDSLRREYATKLRDNFSPDACTEIGKQGFLLTKVFRVRFKEYKLNRSDWELLTVDEQLVGGASFLWDLVVTMEADVGNRPFVEYLGEPSVQK